MAKTEKSEMVEVDGEDLKSLVKSVGQLAETQAGTFRKIRVHEAKFPTPWNPSGERRTLKLKPASVSQNGGRINPVMLSDEEITLINQLKPGLYNKKKWRVVRRRDKSIDIQYPNASLEARFELKGEAGNFAGMLKRIVLEQEAQEQRRKLGEPEDDDE